MTKEQADWLSCLIERIDPCYVFVQEKTKLTMYNAVWLNARTGRDVFRNVSFN